MFTSSIQERIVTEYFSNQNATMSSLAKEYRCSPATIRKILILNGVPESVRRGKRKIPTPRRRFTEDSKKCIAELYLSDPEMTIRKIAERYGCHHSTVLRILSERVTKDVLMPRRRGVGISKFTRNVELEIVSKYLNNSDVTIKDLAEEYDCAPETVTRILHRNGVPKDLITKRAIQVTSNKRSRHILESAKMLTLDKAWILGVICGDAHHDIKNGRLILESGDKKTDWEFLTLWKQKLEKVYGIGCTEWRRRRKVTGYVLTSRAASNDIINYLSPSGTYAWRIPKAIMEGSDEAQQGFLKAFFDSEAFIDRTGIVIKSVNGEGLEDIRRLLSMQAITSKVSGPHYEEQKKCLACSKRMSLRHTVCRFCGSEGLEKVVRMFYRLRVGGYRNITIYAEKVGFDLTRKRKRLKALVERKPKFRVNPRWRRRCLRR